LREFVFAASNEIPEIPGVTEAYLGHIPVSQFLSIIRDDDGEIIQSIFYDDVRDCAATVLWGDRRPERQ
jgi:hypothetical protein